MSYPDRLDFPPQYLAAEGAYHTNLSLKARSPDVIKGEYASVAILDHDDENNEILAEAESSTFPPHISTCGLSVANGVFSGMQSNVLDVEDLSAFLISQPRSVPQIYARVTGYYAQAERDWCTTQKEAFSFSLPLPQCHLSHSTLFAFADDAPCLRGGSVKRSSKEDSMLAKGVLSEAWSVAAETDEREGYQAQNEICLPATAEAIARMDMRLQHAILPPWLPLGEQWSSQWHGGETLSRAVGVTAIKRALTHFLKGRPEAWCRWLIIPQSAYGWDAAFIEEELSKMIKPLTTENIDGNPNVGPVKRISISLGAVEGGLPPAFAFRLFKNRIFALLYRGLRVSSETAFISFIIFGLIFWFTLIILVGMYDKGDISRARMCVSLGSISAFLIISVVPIFVLPAKEAVYCHVGVAWALKSWKSTGMPVSSSRQEVIAEIRQRGTHLAGTFQDKSVLQRRPDGWYIMEGTSETSWIESHRELIGKAIQERRNGSLLADSMTELAMVRQQLAQYESDEAIDLVTSP